jgi:hypothetical protein
VENRDCGEAQSCLYGADRVGACTLDLDLGCETGVGRECAEGLVCANDRCVSTCRTSVDCPSDGACRFAPAIGVRVCVDLGVGPPPAGCELVTDVCVGDQFACALRNGGVVCWGDDGSSQHGDHTPTSDFHPTPVVGPNLAPLDDIVQIDCGARHACALDASGDVLCWGSNSAGQLADAPGLDVDAAAFVHASVSEPLEAVEIVVEGDHSCARSADDRWRCWGANANGEIDATGVDLSAADVVPALDGARDVSFGLVHGCVATAAGVRCRGASLVASGPLGPEELGTPAALAALTDAIDVGLGAHHSCALSATATWCWGDDGVGQLGDGDTMPGDADCTAVPCSFAPLDVVGGPFEQLVSGASADATCAIASGALWCWGANGRGEIDASLADAHAPVARAGLPGEVCDAAIGRTTICALVASTTGGDVYCWGENGAGQLGILPDGDPHATPLLVTLGR